MDKETFQFTAFNVALQKKKKLQPRDFLLDKFFFFPLLLNKNLVNQNERLYW